MTRSGTAPRLSHDDIRHELGRIFRRERRSRLVALWGTGEGGEIAHDGRSFEVVPTLSELDLRSRMPAPGEKLEDGRVFLVDWAEDSLPLDLRCRLAGGRLFQITSEARLAGAFGARECDPALLDTGLATLVLNGEVTELGKVRGLRIGRIAAYRRVLDRLCGLDRRVPLERLPIITWCVESTAGPGLAPEGRASAARKTLRQELRHLITSEVDALTGLAWQAWETESGPLFLALAVLAQGACSASNAEERGALRAHARHRAPGWGAKLVAMGEELAVSPDVAEILRSLSDERRRAVLELAEQEAEAAGLIATREASLWLQAGHAAREAALAEAITAALADLEAGDLSLLKERLAELERHGLDQDPARDHCREGRRKGLQLLAWLIERAGREPIETPRDWEACIARAEMFAAEGGFVDWARRRLRGASGFGEALDQALHAVLAAADEARRADDRAFAEALLAWWKAGRPVQGALPIHEVTRRVVGPFLDEDPRRRLLVILMDGMSVAEAAQLSERLERSDWGPVAWRPKGHEGPLPLPPVLASIPSLTKVSRADFFAGKSDARHGHHPEAEDSRRWKRNPVAVKAGGTDGPSELVLRAELMTGGKLDDELKEKIQGDDGPRLIAVVVNALDEQLKGSSQLALDWSGSKAFVKPLEALLEAAKSGERAVLLASDHGHVLGETRRESRPPSEKGMGGKRWRVLADGEPVREGEVVLPEGSWRPKGAERVAALWDEGCFNGPPLFGEHGGVSQSEVVAPLLLIAPEWLARLHGAEDAALAVGRWPTPAWWALEPTVAVELVAGPEPEDDKENQLGLFAEPAASTPAVLQTPFGDESLAAALEASRLFKELAKDVEANRVKKTLRAVAALGSEPAGLTLDDFSRRVGLIRRRAEGELASMAFINVDGYPLLEYDAGSGRVRLHRERLKQQYELEEA